QFFHDYSKAKTPPAKTKILDAYKMMQTMRMSVYDISDIAYDAYLLNGHTKTSPWTANVKMGDVVRLRFIGAGASTIFHIKIPGTTMLMVQADGNNVKPYSIKHFSISPGDTFDVLVKITKDRPYIIYAESIDSLGTAIGVLKTQPNQVINYKNIKPFPKPQPIIMMNHATHKGGSHPSSHSMQNTSGHKMMAANKHHGHNNQSIHGKKMPHNMAMQHTKKITQSLSSKTKYDRLQSPVKTNNPNTPVHIIHMNLSGYMDRYIWFLNGVPFYKAKPIMIKHGQWYRIIFTNDTMMHHPMHIHGHWFILRNGHGAYDPKLHTIDVPPGATVIADLHANETGQWFFHCHNLIHMKAGMANIFRYTDTPKEEFVGLSGHKTIRWHYANDLELSGDFIHHTYEISLNTLIGSDYNKLQLYARDIEIENGKLTHANIDVFYWRLISQFWAIKGGVNYVYRPSSKPYIQPGIGIVGLMPYFIKTNIRTYLHHGSTKLDIQLERNTQITHRIFLKLNVEGVLATKTIAKDEIGSGLNSLQWTIQPYYQLNSNVALYLQYKHTNYYGALRNILANEGAPTREDIYSLGLELLF
ncbi:MAG: copper oxidase, partial [Thiotrichales bacterium]